MNGQKKNNRKIKNGPNKPINIPGIGKVIPKRIAVAVGGVLLTGYMTVVAGCQVLSKLVQREFVKNHNTIETKLENVEARTKGISEKYYSDEHKQLIELEKIGADIAKLQQNKDMVNEQSITRIDQQLDELRKRILEGKIEEALKATGKYNGCSVRLQKEEIELPESGSTASIVSVKIVGQNGEEVASVDYNRNAFLGNNLGRNVAKVIDPESSKNLEGLMKKYGEVKEILVGNKIACQEGDVEITMGD